MGARIGLLYIQTWLQDWKWNNVAVNCFTVNRVPSFVEHLHVIYLQLAVRRYAQTLWGIFQKSKIVLNCSLVWPYSRKQNPKNFNARRNQIWYSWCLGVCVWHTYTEILIGRKNTSEVAKKEFLYKSHMACSVFQIRYASIRIVTCTPVDDLQPTTIETFHIVWMIALSYVKQIALSCL